MSRFVLVALIVFAALFGWWAVNKEKQEISTDSDGKLPTSWRHFNAPSGKFDVFFPSIPLHATDVVNSSKDNESRKYEMFFSEHNDGSVFMVTQITLPSDTDLKNPDLIYENYLQELVKSNPQNSLKEQHNEKIQDMNGLEFLVQNDQADIHGQIFLVDHDLFILSHIFKRDQVKTSSFKQFVSSFHYHNEEEAKH